MTIYLLSYGALLVSVWYRKVKNRGRHSTGVRAADLVAVRHDEAPDDHTGRHRSLSQEEKDLAAWQHEMVTDHRTGEYQMVLDVPPLVFLDDAGTPFYDQLSPMLSEFELESFTQSWNRRELDDILAGGVR
jgi:hypothetical protein